MRPVTTDGVRAASGRQSTAAWAAEQVRRRILDERVPPGTRLGSQDELVAELGVSWGSGRETLRLLAEQGLIVSRPGPSGGVYVTSPRSDSVINAVANYLNFRDLTPAKLHAARQAVEPPLASLAALDPARNGELLFPILAEEASMLDERVVDQVNWAVVAVRFHAVVVKCSPDDPLSLFAESLLELASSEGRQLSARPREPASKTLSRHRENHEQHLAIASAIARGAASEAEDLMRRHLEHTRQAVAELSAPHQPTRPKRLTSPQ
jgi:DNA-binding FadR family transcriptional regulator